MSNSPGIATGRGARGAALLLTALAVLALPAPGVGAVGVSDQPESPRIPFTQRYHAVQHGGIVRTANAAITCRTPGTAGAASCAEVQRGGPGVNGDYEMFYTDEDDDPNTYNSSRARLALPAGAKVTYARLYWGGNLRVGEQKPPKDNGRVLIAEPGGRYKEVLADITVAHRDADGADAFQASADITPLVRESVAGLWTVAQINVAMGRSETGAWGGWTLAVAYEDPAEPLRHLSLWDGFQTLNAEHPSYEITLDGLKVPAGAEGLVGIAGYDGDRGVTGDRAGIRTNTGKTFDIKSADGADNPADDLMNSTITGPGTAIVRQPAHMNTLGYDSDVFDIGAALVSGATSLSFRFETENLGYSLGVLFVQADTRR
ncbi:DUF3344 domain-containing protein [Streptomyces sp. NPDC058953]|uniref:DUF3344 domain-containing protein n=1 Tax=unclassified Streptomyces TaxID=2593676 RepID=UPI0036AE38D4